MKTKSSIKWWAPFVTLSACMYAMVIYGCACWLQPGDPHEWMLGRIKVHAQEIQSDGWTDELVRQIVEDAQTATCFTLDRETLFHQVTPQRFIDRGLRGDCNEISTYMLWALLEAGYPMNQVCIAVYAVGGQIMHANLKVWMPSGRWAEFESSPGLSFERLAMNHWGDVYPAIYPVP